MEFLNSVFSVLPIWLLWPAVAGIAVYWYLTKNSDYWKRHGIPYVEGIPVLSSVIQLFTKPLHGPLLETYLKLGRIFGTYEVTQPVLFIGEPDILRDIMVKDFPAFPRRRGFNVGIPVNDKMVGNLQGEDWKRVRTVMTPAFSTGKLKRMISIFTDSAKTLANNLRAADKEGKHIDAKRLFGAFTMDVIASSAFATKIDSHNDPENPFVSAARGAFNSSFPWRIILFFLFPGLMKFLRISIFSPSAMTFFEKVILQLVEERKRGKQKRNDYLQLLLDAVEREGKEPEDVKESEEITEIGHEETNEKIFSSYQSNQSLSNIEMVANSLVFFLAGFETTAATLSFTAYELALNPDVQERAIEEIDKAIREKGGLNYDALCEMKYLDNIIYESLRKYPSAVIVDRVAEEDYEIKDPHSKINFTVPKGMIVAIPIYAIHHDPEHYPDPEKYDPDRFSPEQKSTRHPYAFIPFGAGPRNCVAMRFALMEIKVCLANALSQFRLRTCAETDIPLKFRNGTMQPKQIALKAEARTDGNKI